ncbi:MAG: helix-turn-helix domain-containing protein [Candidatus Thermoplasmatota archaeon]|jgi:DNA-binding transcriptional ArsR family regulator|nr:helix-turn-helix domain-containing protein [Candidatus Thermoplasmatota archaeon]
MPKVTLNLNDFKALASEVRLDILRTLDGKKLSLNEIETATKLHKMTLHEHLSKLVESGFVNKIEREGHKWVYYKLSWKGESLIHPENTKIVILFSTTFITLFLGIIGLIHIVQNITASQISHTIITKGPTQDISSSTGLFFGSDPILIYVTIICLILFIIFMIISLWRYKKNKIPKL